MPGLQWLKPWFGQSNAEPVQICKPEVAECRSRPEKRVSTEGQEASLAGPTEAVPDSTKSAARSRPAKMPAAAGLAAMATPLARFPQSGNKRVAAMASAYGLKSFSVSQVDPVFTIGSCFARGVEIGLARRGFDVPMAGLRLERQSPVGAAVQEPLGLLNKYTPHSMINEVEAAFRLCDTGGFFHPGPNGDVIDIQLNVSSAMTLADAQDIRGKVEASVRAGLERARLVVITLGLVECWYDCEARQYTNTMPDPRRAMRERGRFEFHVLGPQAAINSTVYLIELMRSVGQPDQRVLLSVSPVAFGRTFVDADVLAANAYSKAVLRVAAHAVAEQFAHVNYFASYETVLNSCRSEVWEGDYRHVKRETVAHNVGNMIEAYVVKTGEPVSDHAVDADLPAAGTAGDGPPDSPWHAAGSRPSRPHARRRRHQDLNAQPILRPPAARRRRYAASAGDDREHAPGQAPEAGRRDLRHR